MYIYAYVKQVIATSYFETVDNISCLSCSYFKANSIVITFIHFFNVKKSTTFHSHPVNCFVKNVFVIFFSVFFFPFSTGIFAITCTLFKKLYVHTCFYVSMWFL